MRGEILIVSAVLVVALLPLLRRALADRKLGTRVVLAAVGLCWIVLAVSLGQALQHSQDVEEQAPADRSSGGATAMLRPGPARPVTRISTPLGTPPTTAR
jgi:hypothetical protein